MGKKLLKTHKVDFAHEEAGFRWYVVVCQFNWERKAAENIQKRFESLGCSDKFGEILVPIVEFEDVSTKGKRIKKVRNVLESGYIFIKMILNNDTWNVVRQTTGVAGWLNMDGRPMPVNEESILKIKQQLAPLTEAEKSIIEFKGKIGNKIVIKNHAMKDMEAEIIEINKEKEIVKATLLSNGFKLELNFDQIEVV